ncbi:MAG: M48 family metallopeptidase [Pseudohaliea sp.]
MDFFAQQELARRNTRLLVLLFTLAVVGLVLLTNLLVAGLLFFSEDYNVYAGSRGGWAGFLRELSWDRFGAISAVVVGSVFIVSLVKWLQLAAGGRAIAETLGAERVLPQTRDADERRALNIVQEIALAAGMPVPDLYLLRDERGINAFAAGVTQADAVIAVTSGALHHLKRQELQGVIGHEFSHILNGDMRLNVRLAALLKGITFIGDIGYLLLRAGTHRHRVRTGTRGSKNSGAALPVFGLGLLVIGWIGGTCAGFIKAAISRQKEFLADAGAVQFTRDPDGIADALKVIGGYVPGTLVHRARAAELSHMFFGAVTHRLWQGFATHPPLDARIRRIQPRWDGEYITRKVRHYPNTRIESADVEYRPGREALVAAVAAAEAARGFPVSSGLPPRERPPAADGGAPAAPPPVIPPGLLAHVDDPLGASSLVLGLLISVDPGHRDRQLALIAEREVPGQATLVNTVSPGLAALPAGLRLPLVNRCLPALRTMSAPQYRTFKETLLAVIHADRRTELLEWCLYQLVRHYLDPEFVQVTPSRPRYGRLRKVADPLREVLSVLAHEGSGEARAAFALARGELALPNLTLKPRESLSVRAFSEAVHTLADCYPLLKPRILKAMGEAASENGHLCPVEYEILASIAAVIDCPLPENLKAPPL